jgi:signal transduction histidine kinase/DNA-binding response OmpR family regulator
MKTKTKARNKSYTILIIEDSPTQALQLRRTLEEEGFRTAVSQNGKEALSYLKEKRPTIIISDIVMPEMDGYELCTRIKADENLKDIPVILLTALTSPEDVIKGLQCGADNFITKPYEKGFLLSRIQYIMANQEVRKKGTTEVGLNIYFMGQRHTITSNRMQIIDLLLATYEHAVVQNQELRRTQAELKKLNKQLEEKVKQRTHRIEHLNFVLHAIRGVNQLIIREKNRDRLIKKACDSLVANRGYYSAWIAIMDESGKLERTAEAGLGKHLTSMMELMKRGEVTKCGQRALKQSRIITTKDPSSTCTNCPLAKSYLGTGVMTVRLEHMEKVYGLLSVSTLKDCLADEEEQALLKEISEDIGFALYNIELEEERTRSEKDLKKYSEKLERMVEERTKELKDAHEKLVRKEKLAVLGQLAGGMSHELRNPLGAIKNAAYFLNMAVEKQEPEIKETLEILDREVINSEKIINSLLDFAQRKPPALRKLKINDVLEDTLSRTPVPKNVAVVSHPDEALPTILADPDQLSQAFGKIILNAIQAMPEGGELTITGEESHSNDAIPARHLPATLSLARPAGREAPGKPAGRSPKSEIRIQISDTGMGIPKENLGKVFEPLFTTRAKGIGLGLPLARILVEGHGGTIEVDSEVGKGSTFMVRLPSGFRIQD